MNVETLERKRKDATAAVTAFAVFLHEHGERDFAKTYDQIAAALEMGNHRDAVSLERTVPKGGMGSLGDRYWDNEQDGRRFMFLSNASARSITNLRVYEDYGLDHPPVDVSEESWNRFQQHCDGATSTPRTWWQRILNR